MRTFLGIRARFNSVGLSVLLHLTETQQPVAPSAYTETTPESCNFDAAVLHVKQGPSSVRSAKLNDATFE
jgi:hypothetical protein